MTIPAIAGRALHTVGPSALGWTMPTLADRWTSQGSTPTESGDLLLSVSGGTWLAPMPGMIIPVEVAARGNGLSLLSPEGTTVSGGGVLAVLPQAWRRLGHLYASAVEASRPVPRFFLFHNWAGTESESLTAGADLGVDGAFSAHDVSGQPIDPVAVAAALAQIAAAHPVLHKNVAGTGPSFLADVLALAADRQTFLVRLSDPDGAPADPSALTGLTPRSAGSGLYETTGGIALIPSAQAALRLSLWPNGTSGTSVTIPSPSTALARDFVTVRVTDLPARLAGAPDPAFKGTTRAPVPAIRLDEPLTMLADGNDVAGACAEAAGGAATLSLAVAASVSGTFTVPGSHGATAHWPVFPPASGTPGTIGAGLRNSLTLTAAWITGTGADVALTITGLPALAAARAYPRVFDRLTADVTRGDGAGGAADAGGRLTVALVDPFGLAPSRPAEAVLHLDLVVVDRAETVRTLGDLSAPVSPAIAGPSPGGPNPLATATSRGVCDAGILGRGTAGPPAAPPPDAASYALALLSEGNPRDAPRLPTMARRDLLVAGRGGDGRWRGVLSGGRLTRDLLSADPRRGNPGSPGGGESQQTGVFAEGLLAYDIARAAHRRTTNVITRLTELAGSQWDEPPAPAASGETFAGAVLQTVSRTCETPELSLLRGIMTDAQWDALDGIALDPLLARVRGWVADRRQATTASNTAMREFLQQMLDGIDVLRANPPASLQRADRVVAELRRELAAACYGRRDAQWSLSSLVTSARRFLYIETPAIAPTSGATGPHAIDLWGELAAQMSARPALHVVVCVPRDPAVGPGYEPFAAREITDRSALLESLPTWAESDPEWSRIVVFHPIGFPGRRSQLDTTLVVADDLWALLGACTLRRRGLGFDGSADLAFTQLAVTDGVCPALTRLRREVMAFRLGLAPGTPGFVELTDGITAFHAVRARLRAGGLGTIEPLAPAGAADPGALSRDLTDPDGETFDPIAGLIATWFAGASTARP